MSLQIERRETEGIVILDLKGPLTWAMEIWSCVTDGPHCINPGGQNRVESQRRKPHCSFFPDRALKRFDVLNLV